MLLSLPLSAGVLVCVFCIVAVQGAFQIWSLALLGVLAGVCLLFTLLIWRQPESKTKLSFKVRCIETQNIVINVIMKWMYFKFHCFLKMVTS